MIEWLGQGELEVAAVGAGFAIDGEPVPEGEVGVVLWNGDDGAVLYGPREWLVEQLESAVAAVRQVP
jgi:hypothetical protein